MKKFLLVILPILALGSTGCALQSQPQTPAQLPATINTDTVSPTATSENLSPLPAEKQSEPVSLSAPAANVSVAPATLTTTALIVKAPLPVRPVTQSATEIFKITSNVFVNGGIIPKKYTCEGTDTRPQLKMSNAPEKTQTFAIIVDDPQPDAPGGAWLHWTVWNIPANQTDLAEGVKVGVEGATESSAPGYSGPCPPSGPAHIYHFRAYALDTTLKLNTGATLSQLKSAMNSHILAQAELKGSYSIGAAAPTSNQTAIALPTRPATTTSSGTTAAPATASGGIPDGASTRCSDSEASDNPSIFGNVTIKYAEYGSDVYQNYASYDDVCIDLNNVKKFACAGSRDYSSKSVACPSGTTCSAGKCAKTTTASSSGTTTTGGSTATPANGALACSDSDGGKVYNTKGTVSRGDYLGTDDCFISVPNRLWEYFCNADNTVGSEAYNCPGTCSNGACVAATAPVNSGTSGGTTANCSTNSDCGYKQICQSGNCVSVDCTTDSQCGSCQRCSDNSCRSCGYGPYGCYC